MASASLLCIFGWLWAEEWFAWTVNAAATVDSQKQKPHVPAKTKVLFWLRITFFYLPYFVSKPRYLPNQLKLKTSSGFVYCNVELSLVTKLYRMKKDWLPVSGCHIWNFKMEAAEQKKKTCGACGYLFFFSHIMCIIMNVWLMCEYNNQRMLSSQDAAENSWMSSISLILLCQLWLKKN